MKTRIYYDGPLYTNSFDDWAFEISKGITGLSGKVQASLPLGAEFVDGEVRLFVEAQLEHRGQGSWSVQEFPGVSGVSNNETNDLEQ
jgi:hypothetical protein